MNDEEIIKLFENRNQEAFLAVNQNYGFLCKNVIHKILVDHRDVDECLNDTWLALWNLIPPNHPNPLLSYILRIAKNQALKKLEYNRAVKRNNYYDATLEEIENHFSSLTSVENAMEEQILQKFINHFLAKEKKMDRIIFVKRYWYLESIDQISKECGKSKNYVSVHLHRCRERLKDALVKEGLFHE